MNMWASKKVSLANRRGFTLVELLIVIVVIAILAAISIIAYNGVQTRGKNSAVRSTAASVVKKAELYNTEMGHYPLGMSVLTGASSSEAYSVSGIVYGGTLNNDTATNAVTMYVCGSGSPTSGASITSSTVTGGRIYYRDYQASNNKSDAYGVVSGTGINCHPRN